MNNNMNEQNNQGMNNAFPTNGTGTFFNNVSQPTNQPYNQTFTNNNINNNNNLNQNNYNNINTSNYVPNNNGKNNNKTKKKIIPIVVIIVIVVILLALIGRNLNSTENYKNNPTTENDSGTPKNSTINPGETIKIREDKYLNIDFKYLSYDSTGYAEDRNVLFKAEITNKSKEKKYMTGTEISIYDSSNNKIGHCFSYSSAEREEGSISPMIEPEKTMIVYYYCYILSTSDLSQIDKAKYEKTYMNSDFKDETVQYNLNIN